MRWGLRVVLFAALTALAASALPGAAGAAEGPTYEEGPVYTPAPVAKRGVVRFAGLKRNRRSGRAVLFVRVSGPGKVFLWGRGVRRVRRGARGPARVRLPVLPKVPLKRFLKRRGKAAIRVEVGFQPVAGIPRTFEKRVLLKRRRAPRFR